MRNGYEIVAKKLEQKTPILTMRLMRIILIRILRMWTESTLIKTGTVVGSELRFHCNKRCFDKPHYC
jgi:hypothetical protein